MPEMKSRIWWLAPVWILGYEVLPRYKYIATDAAVAVNTRAPTASVGVPHELSTSCLFVLLLALLVLILLASLLMSECEAESESESEALPSLSDDDDDEEEEEEEEEGDRGQEEGRICEHGRLEGEVGVDGGL